MIFYKNQVNEVVLEVSENVTLDAPVFLFEFISSQTQASSFCIAANTSTTQDRFDLFEIEDKANPTATLGEVHLTEGQYWLKVYEQEDADNLDPELTTSVLGETMVRVIDSSASTDKEYSGSSTEDTAYSGGD